MKLKPVPQHSSREPRASARLRADDGITFALIWHDGSPVFRFRLNTRLLYFSLSLLFFTAIFALVTLFTIQKKEQSKQVAAALSIPHQNRVLLLEEMKAELLKQSYLYKAAGHRMHKKIWGDPSMNKSSPDELGFISTVSDNLKMIDKSLHFLTIREEAFQNMPVGMPLDAAYVTSMYGKRTNPFGFASHFHTGVDFANVIGTPIKAAADGVVLNAGGDSSGYGLFVRILHKHGFVTLYAHCNRVLVSRGDEIKRGQVIATLGESGSATGPHLHYEVRMLKEVGLNPSFVSLNPWPFVKESL